MRNVFIIGATGKVGGAVVRQLATQGDVKVSAGVRNVEQAKASLPKLVNVVPFDLDHRDSIEPALVGIDAVLLMTGYTVDMMKQSKRVIDSAKATGVKSIIHVGASDNTTAEVAHWGWHQMIEAYIVQRGFNYTFLHPEAYMQNLTAFGWLQNGNLTNLIGDAIWSWVDANDVGLLAAEALRRPDDFKNQHWSLGYAAASMANVAQMLSAKLDTTVKTVPLSPDVFYEGAVAAGGDSAYLACIRDQFHMSAAGTLKGLSEIFDASKFEKAVGRAPITWDTHINLNLETLNTAVRDR